MFCWFRQFDRSLSSSPKYSGLSKYCTLCPVNKRFQNIYPLFIPSCG